MKKILFLIASVLFVACGGDTGYNVLKYGAKGDGKSISFSRPLSSKVSFSGYSA